MWNNEIILFMISAKLNFWVSSTEKVPKSVTLMLIRSCSSNLTNRLKASMSFQMRGAHSCYIKKGDVCLKPTQPSYQQSVKRYFFSKIIPNCCEMIESISDKQKQGGGGGGEVFVMEPDRRSEIHHFLLKAVACSYKLSVFIFFPSA